MSCSFTPLASVEDCVTVFVRHCAALIAPLTIHVGLYVAGRWIAADDGEGINGETVIL